MNGCPGPTPTNGVFLPYHMGNVSMDGSSSLSPTSARTNASVSTSPQPHPNATCWEILTLRLGRFARQHIEQHGAHTVTDKMLQQKAREILYESDDPWNQTAADNPEWLNLFKKAHGIDNTETRAWKHQDILEDLGIRVDAQLDRSFNLKNFDSTNENLIQPNLQVDPSFDLSNFQVVAQPPDHAEAAALAYECSLSGTLNMSMAGHRVSGSTTPFTPPNSTSQSTPGTSSHLPTTFLDLSDDLSAPIGEYACTEAPGGICLGENSELAYAVHEGECARLGDTDYFLQTPNATAAMSMPPVQQTRAAASLEDPFGLASWDQNFGASLPHATTGLSASVPAGSGSGIGMGIGLNKSVTSFGGNSQAWDDSELDFSIDMDIDMDFNGGDVDLTDLDMDHLMGMGPNGAGGANQNIS